MKAVPWMGWKRHATLAQDMGHKMGCNGVDNGKLWFDGA